MSSPSLNDADLEKLCLHQWFEIRARGTPEAIAVVFEKEHLSFGELNRRSNQLAHRLRCLGAGPDVLVSLLMDRSLEMIIAIVGVLKAGAAYLPMDPAYPQERLDFMMRDAKSSILLTDQESAGIVKSEGLAVLTMEDDFSDESDANPGVEVTPDHLAYCIYTSGSTGTPKGVLISHRNVVRLFTQTDHWFKFNTTDVWSFFHSYAFDVSVFELWGALLFGGQLVVVPYLTTRTPEAFYKLLEEKAVTVLSQTPSAFQQLLGVESSLTEARKLQLRYIIFAGEKLELHALKPWIERHGDEKPKLINMYGITETTVHVTFRQITGCDLHKPSLVGLPIPDLEVHLLDPHLEPVKNGEPGEICVSGPGLARGYLNRKSLTAERFIHWKGKRLYRSGDLARRVSDGELEYIGRIDRQVKIRGHRIELGEIESILHRHASVRTAVVIVRESRLTAYLVPHGEAPTVSELRLFLLKQLPDYMVPATFIFLGSLPLTNNGKVDRNALPDPEHDRPRLREPYRAPESRAEQILADSWSEVLDIHPVGVDDNFFELGGDSIRMIEVQALAQKHGISFTTEQLFKAPTIHALARDLAGLEWSQPATGRFVFITEEDRKKLPVNVEDAYPLTALQAGMQYHRELETDTAMYHDVFSYRIGCKLDARKMEEALQIVIDRHSLLRTAFDWDSYSEPLQLVYRKVSPPWDVEDLSELEDEQKRVALASWIDEEKKRPFAKGSAPMVRFHVHQYGPCAFQFFVSFYHAAFDGWSLARLVSETLREYVSLLNGKESGIPPLQAFYPDYLALEREAIQSESCRRFWETHLKDAPRQKLPRWPETYRSGGTEQIRRAGILVKQEVFEGLKQLAGKTGVSLRTVLLAAHFRALQVLTGEADMLSGVLTNGRPEVLDGDRMLGLFLNMVPLRMQMSGGSWQDLVYRTYETEGAMLPYRRFPFIEIQKLCGCPSAYEAAFNYVNWRVFNNLEEELGIDFSEGPYFEANNFVFLANFILDSDGKHLRFHLFYDPRHLAEGQIESLEHDYAAILEAMALEPDSCYDAFNPLGEAEKRMQLVELNETRRPYPDTQCIHQIFEEQVTNSPNAIALVHGDKTWTYRELNQQADHVAAVLQSREIEADTPIGLCMERSPNMIAAMLGILKSGGAYLPLNPTYPDERVELMVKDCNLKIILTESSFQMRSPFTNLDTLCIDTFPPSSGRALAKSATGSDRLAYVIYTSGSTGRPKGVAIPHRGVVRLLFGTEYATLGPEEIILHHSSESFDASTFEIWGALLHGGCCVLAPDRELTARRLGELIRTHGITILWLTAAYYNVVIDESPKLLSGVKQLLVGGESLSVDHIRRGLQHLPGTRFVNGYGPTESTTFACCYPIPTDLPENMGSIPIGKPISNTRVYILNQRLEPVPVGTTGELCISGDGLARGYLNQPELTAEKFIDHDFGDGKRIRLYRTGDRARYLPDGTIEFIGRTDNQVKVRGYRIELEEIETVLLKHPGVKEVAVIAREDRPGEKQLVGYVVWKPEASPSMEDIWNFLRGKLPGFMVPPVFVFLASLPLNANGKIDFAGLPAPDQSRPELEQAFVAPRTQTEEDIAELWCELLKKEKVGVRDNFLELGGHSLTAMRVASRLGNLFGVKVTLRVLFDNLTIEALAAYVDNHRPTSN
jgi:amino acid adenylation domain-containing protein